MKTICGIIPAMATPMLPGGALDIGAVKQLADRLIMDGASGIFAAGTMGECAYLSVDERVELAQATARAVNGRVPVIAGTGAAATGEVIRAGERLKDSGVDLVSVVMPYYFTLTQEEIYRHFATIIEKSPIPVMAYNIPKFTINHMEAATAAKLYREHGMVGIKDSSGNLDTIKSYIQAADSGFSVVVGSDPLILDGLKQGACAAISAPANVLTRVVCAIYAGFSAGDTQGAQRAQSDWDRAIKLIMSTGSFPATVKLAMSRLSVPAGDCRPPVLPANADLFKAVLPELIAIGEKYL